MLMDYWWPARKKGSQLWHNLSSLCSSCRQSESGCTRGKLWCSWCHLGGQSKQAYQLLPVYSTPSTRASSVTWGSFRHRALPGLLVGSRWGVCIWLSSPGDSNDTLHNQRAGPRFWTWTVLEQVRERDWGFWGCRALSNLNNLLALGHLPISALSRGSAEWSPRAFCTVDEQMLGKSKHPCKGRESSKIDGTKWKGLTKCPKGLKLFHLSDSLFLKSKSFMLLSASISLCTFKALWNKGFRLTPPTAPLQRPFLELCRLPQRQVRNVLFCCF